MKRITVDTNPVTVNIKDVNRIIFHVFFPIKRVKEDIINRIMLRRFLLTASKKFDTPEKKGKEYLANMIIDHDVTFTNFPKLTLLDCKLIVPKENIIDGYSIEGAINYFYEMIFNLKIENNAFEKKVFDEEKAFLIQNESEFPRDINEFAYEEYNKFVDPEEDIVISEETYLKLLDEVTPESVYEYYKKLILDNNYFTFIGGDIDKNPNVVEKFNKVFKQSKNKKDIDIEYFNIRNYEDYQEKVIKTNYNQSMVFVHYNFKDYCEDDNYKLRLLSYLLDSPENNLFYNKLRGENGIIYTFNSSFRRFNGEILIVLYVDKSNIEVGKKLVSEVFDIIKDKDVFEECKRKTLKAMTYDMLGEEDNPFNPLEEKLSDYFSYDKGLSEDIKILEKVSYEDIMALIDRMIQTRTVIIESGDNNE